MFNREGLYCCDIITFNTIAMKGAIKDVGRALGMSVEETQSISDAVEQDEKHKDFIPQSYKDKYPLLFQYVDIVSGTIVSVGNHPAGLVVSPHDVNEAFGTFYSSANTNPISQINMKAVDALNYVKLDVLGLDCVGLINQTCELANIPRLTPDNMKFDDMNVWNDLKDDCTLVFQFESEFAESYLQDILRDETINNIKAVNPNFSYIDLMSMANGAIRPAGASYREQLAQGIYKDNGHKALNDFLAPTLGYLVYQEQLMMFLHLFCGYTMGEADVVRRGFAKKTGTEKFIPTIKSGFIKTMKEQYNVPEEKSEELISDFLQVIIDASDYLFSKNHSDPYSFLGFGCAYLRYYYSLEFLTAAMNIYKEDDAKSKKIKEYAKSKEIEVKPISFGKSKAEYFMDKKENVIYQGINGIKFLNAQIADELYELAQENTYTDFISLLKDVDEKTSVNSRQLTILIGLNFFSEFGKNQKLLDIQRLYFGEKNQKGKIVFPTLSSVKQIKKDQLEKFGISDYLIKKYANKETEKLYKEIDGIGLLKEMVQNVEDKSLDIVSQVKFEIEYLNYCIYANPTLKEDSYYIVTDFVVGKDTTKPRVVLHNLKTGEDVKTRINKGTIYKANPFGKYSILKVDEFTISFKKKPINGVWQTTNETEELLVNYEVIRNEK